jgi:hypothetical protein
MTAAYWRDSDDKLSLDPEADIKRRARIDRERKRADRAGYEGFAWSPLNWPQYRRGDDLVYYAWVAGWERRRMMFWWRVRSHIARTLWTVARRVAPKQTRWARRLWKAWYYDDDAIPRSAGASTRATPRTS